MPTAIGRLGHSRKPGSVWHVRRRWLLLASLALLYRWIFDHIKYMNRIQLKMSKWANEPERTGAKAYCKLKHTLDIIISIRYFPSAGSVARLLGSVFRAQLRLTNCSLRAASVSLLWNLKRHHRPGRLWVPIFWLRPVLPWHQAANTLPSHMGAPFWRHADGCCSKVSHLIKRWDDGKGVLCFRADCPSWAFFAVIMSMVGRFRTGAW